MAIEQVAQSSASLSFRQEEVHLRLKSRSLWLLVGDKIFAFFHRQCRSRLSHNHILEICSSSGEVIKCQLQLQSAANEHFQILFEEDSKTDVELNFDFLSNIPSLVSQEDNAGLVKIFSEKEVVDVIWAMEPDKAPGPGEFSIHFY